MKLLVTGGAGKAGRVLCAGLVAAGHGVVCVDRGLRRQPGVDGRVADLRVREAIYPHLDGVDAVVHLANHAMAFGTDAQTLVAENTAMNVHVFQAAAEAGVRRVIFGSSVQAASGAPLAKGAVPAPLPVYPLGGDSAPLPANAYALSKVMGETMLRHYAERHAWDAVALRLPYLVEGVRGLARQAAGMCADTWPREGFSWLWTGDLAGLVLALLDGPAGEARYRCLLPSAPPMEAFPEVRAALAAHPVARVARCYIPGWSPTPLESLPAPEA
ncbi:MAG: NAD(P)-dependent oxidoreductase [Opitutaceae bacterium]|jgi:nucleoside-diphosphate-sugar epimerase|nr:NAD(P)-dependent oxidoreductase [Opitutaceae bacterium]